MYESEVNRSKESIASLPAGIRERFSEYRSRIAARTLLPWGEHCTECVWPTCYTTCELYAPRVDGAQDAASSRYDPLFWQCRPIISNSRSKTTGLRRNR